jgi:hypothetical protein
MVLVVGDHGLRRGKDLIDVGFGCGKVSELDLRYSYEQQRYSHEFRYDARP